MANVQEMEATQQPAIEFSADREKSCWTLTIKFLRVYWKIVFALLWPMCLMSMIILDNRPTIRCAFVILLMAGYWVSDCFPVAITSLIPIVLFPLFGILSTADTCACYINDTIMVFIGGLILATAIEHSKLHLRIAVGVIKSIGCSHAKLLGGICTVTTFISMWISNTAATAMMLPIIFALLDELEKAGFGNVYESDLPDAEQSPALQRPGMTASTLQLARRPTMLTKAYLLGTAYSATFGGTGTLVGTGTNLTFKGIYENTFPTAPGLSFTDWMFANIPQMIMNSFLNWCYLVIAYMGYLRPGSKEARATNIGKEGEEVANRVIQRRYKELGDITFHEAAVATLFVTCVFLWIFRKPGFVRGWTEMITDIDVKDSTPVILIAILMFFIPKDPSFIYACDNDPTKRPRKASEGLLTWKVIETKMHWSLMFLLGGGFAISKGSVVSSLATSIGNFLLPLRFLPPILILGFVCFFIGFITEFTSNVGIANITLPVVAQMCVAMEIHPLYLMIPATLMCSFSFRLPVGTPPNALVCASGSIPTRSLMIGGCTPSMFSLVIEMIMFPTWGQFVYNIQEFPEWAKLKPASGEVP